MKQDATPHAPADPNLRSRIAAIPRWILVGTGVLVLLLIWLAGTNNPGIMLGLGAVLLGSGLFLWYRDRAIMRGVRRDLEPPAKP